MLRALLAKLRGVRSRAGSDGAERTDDGNRSGDPDDEQSSNSVWDLIPGWQYDGRHVESGGMTRDEQERALRDVQRQAAEIEAAENDDSTTDR